MRAIVVSYDAAATCKAVSPAYSCKCRALRKYSSDVALVPPVVSRAVASCGAPDSDPVAVVSSPAAMVRMKARSSWSEITDRP